MGPNGQYSPGTTGGQHGIQGPGGQYDTGSASNGIDSEKPYGPGVSTGQTGYGLPDSSYGPGNTQIQNGPTPGGVTSYDSNIHGPGLGGTQTGQYGPGQNSGFYPHQYGNGGGAVHLGNGPYGFNNQAVRNYIIRFDNNIL